MIISMMSQYLDQSEMFESERKKATFRKQQLSNIIYKNNQNLQKFLKRQEIVDNDPILRFDPATIHLSRQEMMTIYAQKGIKYAQVMPNTTFKFLQKSLFFYQQMPLSLHESMFIITLKNLCDDQQVKMFLQPAQKNELIGCYAQTELGHGSDVKSLMTTATYDENTESFIMNTPTTKAAKWWIGDLGVFANHACVFAQLYIKGKNYGVHAFIVPIRDQFHKPFPGIQVGDIGPKMGYNCKDNGFLIMNNYKIPRKNMLMKFQRVSKEGKYEVVGDEKITYATMLRIRSLIPLGVYYYYSKAATIITRYSLVRRQFKDTHGQQMPILDYQVQQEKIFPRIAEVYCILFAVKKILKISTQVLEDAKDNNFSKLNEAHIITSSVKGVSTKDGLEGLQIIRRAAGGHGFNSYSALPTLQLQVVPTYTFEGDFTILMLQVARYLLKNYNRVHRGSKKPLAQTVSYLTHAVNLDAQPLDTEDCSQLRNIENILKVYINNSCFRIKKAGQKILAGVTSGMDMKKTWDQHAGIELVEAATAHSYFWMVNNFYKFVQEIADQNTKAALERLCLIFAIDKIIDYSFSFFESKSITPTTLKTLRELREQLLAEIRPDALTLVEAFEYSDNTLMSAIGKSDGKPYENLLECFRKQNEVNQPKKAQEFRQISKDLLKFTSSTYGAKL